MSLNYLCTHDISDDDCYKCEIHGIKHGCDNTCPDFDDVRSHMSNSMLAKRKRLMDLAGWKDKFPYKSVLPTKDSQV